MSTLQLRFYHLLTLALLANCQHYFLPSDGPEKLEDDERMFGFNGPSSFDNGPSVPEDDLTFVNTGNYGNQGNPPMGNNDPRGNPASNNPFHGDLPVGNHGPSSGYNGNRPMGNHGPSSGFNGNRPMGNHGPSSGYNGNRPMGNPGPNPGYHNPAGNPGPSGGFHNNHQIGNPAGESSGLPYGNQNPSSRYYGNQAGPYLRKPKPAPARPSRPVGPAKAPSLDEQYNREMFGKMIQGGMYVHKGFLPDTYKPKKKSRSFIEYLDEDYGQLRAADYENFVRAHALTPQMIKQAKSKNLISWYPQNARPNEKRVEDWTDFLKSRKMLSASAKSHTFVVIPKKSTPWWYDGFKPGTCPRSTRSKNKAIVSVYAVIHLKQINNRMLKKDEYEKIVVDTTAKCLPITLVGVA